MTNPWIAVCALAACGASSKTTTIENGGVSARPVMIAWNAVPAAGERVTVSIVVNSEPVTLGTLDAATDDSPGSPKSCSIADSSPTKVVFGCGATPAYNFYEAGLAGDALTIELVTGVDGEPGSEKRTFVTRVPVTGTALQVAPYST